MTAQEAQEMEDYENDLELLRQHKKVPLLALQK